MFDYQTDTLLMEALINYAATRKGLTGGNPTVAAAVVKDHQVISTGLHRGEGANHAEVEALLQAGDNARGATLFVTLEPCTHYGKTPPCVEAIVKAGIKKVVFAMTDPNPLMKDSGHVLASHHIEVVEGVCREKAMLLNDVFVKNIVKQCPFVTLKVAQSLDGKVALANGDSRYITNEKSRQKVHDMRGRCDVIVVGIGTILKDDPSLNVRYHLIQEKGLKNPAKLILDSQGRCPKEALVFSENIDADVVVLKRDIRSENTQYLKWTDVLDFCWKQGWKDVLIEGGPGVYSSALDEGVVDKVAVFIAPKFMGEKGALSPFVLPKLGAMKAVPQLSHVTVTQFDDDVLIEGYLLL